MMTSTQIRQSFLDFFKSKQHSIVPSASLMPDSPNLLFTNAGMNQFVPIFLGQTRCPYTPGRAADTQKCIRAGGKHNDLDDVGLDTYHHTFFEMLGNWSFGDYFKQEAIEWAWELVVGVWKFPPSRLYATVYSPDKSQNDPSEFDQEAWNFWAEKFRSVGLDPAVHIVSGNKKDNFWMMGETGPCGPCSELHMDLTPAGDTKGALVNKGDARCIEIWNLVFIQFNANPDGTFSPLPAQHVDTGMGFERVTSIIQGTKNLTDFANAKISNYETDIFRPIFDALEKLSGKKYGSTLPTAGEASDQIALDIAFRVIADHIRTLSFAIADGIQPGNTDRNYVLRRILRRAVRYGRTLGFHEPFFYKLVEVLADTMGDIFPEIRAKKKHVQDVIRTEEEAFNKTLDKGIALFNEEVARLSGAASAAPGSARGPRAEVGGPPASRPTNLLSTEGKPIRIESAPGALYSKRRLPHFEKPWAIYHITLTTLDRRQLEPADRDIVFQCIRHWNERRYRLVAACVMPDHAHFIIQPGVESQDPDGKPIFYSLATILHTIKSFTAHEINKRTGKTGGVWEKEKFDRYLRSDSDLEEKFLYVSRNPWDAGLVQPNEPWPWVWTPEYEARRATAAGSAGGPPAESGGPPDSSQTPTSPGSSVTGELVERSVRRAAEHSTPAACAPRYAADAAPVISGAFAFKLYDEQGFPLDLTELMARERGLTVDVEGFNKLMEEQRARARAAQKKEVISLSQIETTTPTKFVGFDTLQTTAKVVEVVSLKDKTAIILDTSACYAEMGGQVGDTGEIVAAEVTRRTPDANAESASSRRQLQITNTQKSGNTFLHFVDGEDIPAAGDEIILRVDKPRRNAIQRHHTVTHLLHYALHEVVSRDASQKGSFVGPEKLTFDFNSAPLTPAQVADIEKLVNERILENAGVSWTEVPFADVKSRKDVMQFFGDKYGDTVRVVQIGGRAGELDGYSMELCGGTHTRGTGEIGLFRIVGESAIAAGVRRIEAIAGLEAYRKANDELALIKSLAGKVNSPIHELEKKVEAMLAQQKKLEKEVQMARQRNASNAASELLERVQTVNGIPLITHNLGDADGDFLQAIADSLKGRFKGVVVLGGVGNNAVALVATVSPDFTAKVQAGKIIQAIAPIVGGKGGGKPDNARGGGKDASQLDEALAKAKILLG